MSTSAIDAEAALTGEAGVDELRRQSVGPHALDALGDVVDGMLEGGASLDRLVLRRVKWKPARKLTTSFDAVVRLPGGAPIVRPLVVVRRPRAPARRRPASALEERARHVRPADPFRRLAAELPGGMGTVAAWPLDPRFPQLVDLSDTGYMDSFLARSGIRARASEIDPLRYRPGERHLLRVDLAPPGDGAATGDGAETGAPAVYVKLGATIDPSSVRRATRLVADAVERSGSGATVVRPLEGWSFNGSVAFPEASGEPLPALLARSDPEVPMVLDRVIRAVAAIHGETGTELPRRRPSDEVEATARACEHVVVASSAGRRVPTLLARIEAVLRQDGPRPCLIHGDLKADHVWVDGSSIRLLDVGTHAGPPGIDLGKFLADLLWWRRKSNEDTAVASFVAEVDPGDEHLRSWTALFILRLAGHRPSLFDDGWEADTTSLVLEAERVLEGGADALG
jgi:hypothetical protein